MKGDEMSKLEELADGWYRLALTGARVSKLIFHGTGKRIPS